MAADQDQKDAAGRQGWAAAASPAEKVRDVGPEDPTAKSDQAADAERGLPPAACPGGGSVPKKDNSWLGERPPVFRSTAQEVAFVFQATVATMSSSFLTGASTIVTASIGRDLAMAQGEISWISASNSLAAGAFQLGLGQLADLLGRRPMFIVGMGSFAAFAVITGFARNPFWMDILCGLLGLSSALMVPPAIGILGAAYDRPSKRKNLAFSAFSSGNPLGFAMGSVLGGIAARLFDWRASFFLIAILWGLFTVLAFWAVPSVEAVQHDGASSSSSPAPGPAASVRQRLSGFSQQFDSVGAVLTLFGTGMFTAAVTLGPDDGWGSPVVIALLVLGVVLLVIFGYWETIWPHPLMPPKIWKDRNFTLLIVSLVFGAMAFNSAVFWLAFFLQQMQGREPLDVALHLLPQAIAGLAWNVVAGSLLHRVNNTLLHGIGAVAYLVANLLLSLMKPDSSYWAFIFPSLILNVVGADFQFNVVNMYVMQSLPSHQQALAGGIFNTVLRLCSTIALGISTAVFSSVGLSEQGRRDPMLQYTRAWQVSVALSAAGIVFVPFIGVGTQGNDKDGVDEASESSDGGGAPNPPPVGVGVAPAAGAQATSSTKEK